MDATFTAGDLIREIRQFARDNPLFTDPKGGLYFWNDAPRCVVGHALNRLGVDSLPDETNDVGIGGLLEEHGVDATSLEWLWLMEVQINNDDGQWARSMVDVADRKIAQADERNLEEEDA